MISILRVYDLEKNIKHKIVWLSHVREIHLSRHFKSWVRKSSERKLFCIRYCPAWPSISWYAEK